ncbi:MAG: aldehyde ferredoxin oxidoreductase family protein [Chloroflexota bacterium]
MVSGYTGRLLRIDLTRRKSAVEPIDYDMARLFIGGRGYCARLLFDEIAPGTDPLGPANKLIFGTGPAVGAPVLAADRYVIVTKSPETGVFLDSYAGGSFSPEVKFAGYDFIILEGKAEKPTYIWINDDDVQLRDASHLWGKRAWETETLLKAEVGDEQARAAVIGPAGEKLSNLAIVQSDYYHQCGRGGGGAVMGSKNVKAVVVRGSKGVRSAHPQALLDYMHKARNDLANNKAAVERMKYGTPLTLNFTNAYGILPTYNFREGQFKDADKIDGYAFRERVAADAGCYGCTLGCTKLARVTSGPFAPAYVGGPEYEADGLLGSNLGINSMDAIIYFNSLCDDLGLDVIGAGNVIGWAIECYERGILSKENTGGLELRFGDAEVVAKMLPIIAYREGLGDLLAQGVRKAAEVTGQGTEEFAMHSKGLEYPAYRPGPNSPGFGLAYAITERGACHRRAWPATAEQTMEPFTTKGRAALVKQLYDNRIPWHCAITCDMPYLRLTPDASYAAGVLSAVTGWELSGEDIQALCDRVASLIRVFNIREGVTREDDTLAPRSFQPDTTGPGAGRALTREMLDDMLDEYYSLRGWGKDGIPTEKTLTGLGMRDIAAELNKYLKASGKTGK